MSNEEVLSAMQAMILPLQQKLEALEGENKKLREEAESPSMGSIANTSGRQVNMRAARSVTITTRPVLDSPNDPLWSGKVAEQTARPKED